MLTAYKPRLDRLLNPCARRLARAGIHPAALTLLGPLLASAACLFLLWTGAVVPFCLAVVVIECLDGLDGAVARAGGRVTKFGGYLDAMADRYVEALVLLSVAQVTGYWGLTGLALTGALLVSYAKARAAMEVTVSNVEWPDLMERTERSLLFLTGLAAGALVPWRPFGRDLFWWTLAALAILTHLTVLQRMLRARRLITARAAE